MSPRPLVIALGILTLSAQPGFGQATQPVADAPKVGQLQPGWEEIDQRLVFLTVRLSSVETSLDAVDKAIRRTGSQQLGKKEDADRYRAGNELMDRKGGGPVRWDEFYGKTAEKFFYHPTDAHTHYRTVTIIQQQPAQSDQQVGTGVASRQGVPVHQRPPQLDYIYRANADGEKRAEQEVGALGDTMEKLVARRRELEAEQSALWCKIAFRVVSSRDLGSKPIYRFSPAGKNLDAAHLQAISAGSTFVRTLDAVVAQAQDAVDKNQPGVYSRMPELTKAARANLVAQLLSQTELSSELSNSRSNLGKLLAAGKRLQDVSENINEAYRVASEGDLANDDQRKNTFRGLLQAMLVNYSETLLAADECVAGIAQDWNVTADAGSPLAAAPINANFGGPVAPAETAKPPLPAKAPETAAGATTPAAPVSAAGDAPSFEKVDLIGRWTLQNPEGKKPGTVMLEQVSDRTYHLQPRSYVYAGIYEVRGDKLVMIKRDGGYSGFIWRFSDADHLELITTNHMGATLAREKK